MSLTKKEANEQADAKHKILYNHLFEKNVKNIDELIKQKIEKGKFECIICNRYCTHMFYLEFPYEEDRFFMEVQIKKYYKDLGYVIKTEDDYITIDWS